MICRVLCHYVFPSNWALNSVCYLSTHGIGRLDVRIRGPWDLDKDGRMNLGDFALLARDWLRKCSSPDWCDGMDRDHSRRVDLADLRSFLEHWMP